MRVVLANPRRSHAHEPGLLVEIGDGGAAAVSHRRAQSSDHLIHDFAEGTAIGYAAFDAFRDELLDVVLCILAISVLAARLHRDRKSTRLNSSHLASSSAVLCLSVTNS